MSEKMLEAERKLMRKDAEVEMLFKEKDRMEQHNIKLQTNST